MTKKEKGGVCHDKKEKGGVRHDKKENNKRNFDMFFSMIKNNQGSKEQ